MLQLLFMLLLFDLCVEKIQWEDKNLEFSPRVQKVIFKELCEQKTYAEVANCHVAKYKSSSYIFSLMYGNSDIFMFNAAFILVLVQDTYYQ